MDNHAKDLRNLQAKKVEVETFLDEISQLSWSYKKALDTRPNRGTKFNLSLLHEELRIIKKFLSLVDYETGDFNLERLERLHDSTFGDAVSWELDEYGEIDEEDTRDN